MLLPPDAAHTLPHPPRLMKRHDADGDLRSHGAIRPGPGTIDPAERNSNRAPGGGMSRAPEPCPGAGSEALLAPARNKCRTCARGPGGRPSPNSENRGLGAGVDFAPFLGEPSRSRQAAAPQSGRESGHGTALLEQSGCPPGGEGLPHPEIEMAWVAWLATFGGHWPILDRLAVALADNELLKAAPYMLVLVGFWHVSDPRRRAGARREIVAGVIAAGLAVVVSRLVQDFFTSVRPIWDPVQSHLFPPEFQRVVEPDYHSFPSDHVALLVPLALTVFRLDRLLGWIGLGWLLVVSLVRLILGLHYPVDV